ncbi:unnamed protein product [Rotaria sordida]|uniref:Uncharacterized protein n=1 Tax=Rotaria sordida TaxID=392033 RepID=A0A815D2T3_9BILA|nr:unnamed protein product [Rotaria sordida]CAF1292950.1 unnamed protein product [Rotaria sordida]CAF1313379.1 unnamed protein product [Rotaria sordida]CAF3756333.1 unnamed protein product [Rotaria sordida]CAF3829112.1 unnamed protein product [Rotaria sordida]
MHTTLMNTFLCFFIVIISITFLSSALLENDEYSLADNDWMDFNSYYPTYKFDTRAVNSRFWKRLPQRHFWKRSLIESKMNNNDMVKSIFKQQDKH